MFSANVILIVMGLVFTIVGSVCRSKSGKAGIVSNSSVESVSIGIIFIGVLLLVAAFMLSIGPASQKEMVAKFALPITLILSIVLVVMSIVALASKDLKDEGTTDQKSAKKNLKVMFGVILALSLVNVIAMGVAIKKESSEGGISNRFGFDFEF